MNTLQVVELNCLYIYIYIIQYIYTYIYIYITFNSKGDLYCVKENFYI